MACLVRVILRIMNSDQHENITEKLSIQPTKVWHKNDIGIYGHVRQYDCWLSETGYTQILDAGDLVDSFLETFYSKKEIIRELKLYPECVISLDVVIQMTKAEVPSIHFSKKTLDFLSFIGAEIDIDMYIMDDDLTTGDCSEKECNA
jgi:hypothetical protein